MQGFIGARFFFKKTKNRLISNFGGIIKMAGVILPIWSPAVAT